MTTNWVGWMVSAVMLLLLFAFGAILANPVRLLITGETAEGVVVGMAQSGSLQAPIFEFVTSSGEQVKVNGRSYSAWTSAREGDEVTVAYNPSQPRDAQPFLLSEFIPASFMLGFIVFFLLIWISFILASGDPAYADPFKLLPAVISRFRLNPVRFPFFFVLSAAIFTCGLGTYEFSKRVLDLRANGIKTVGEVIRSSKSSKIAFKDASGKEFRIQGSSRLHSGDVVEVVYLASHPAKGSVNTWDELYLMPLFLGSMLLAFLGLLRLVLSGSIAPLAKRAGSQKKLKTTGVPAVATVIEANSKSGILHYRIDKETRIPSTRMPTANLDAFDSLELTLPNWKPSQADTWPKKGDQFRAYLDSLKPSKNFYVDFSDRIGHNSFVKSMEDEEKEDEEEEKALIGKLRNLATTSSYCLSQKDVSEVLRLIEADELSFAYEKLVTKIMNLPKPLPAPLQKVDWDDCLELGLKLGLDEEAEDDPEFWPKFRAFQKELA